MSAPSAIMVERIRSRLSSITSGAPKPAKEPTPSESMPRLRSAADVSLTVILLALTVPFLLVLTLATLATGWIYERKR